MITISKSQVSIMNIQYGYYPIEKFLDDAVRVGVKNVELWGAAPHFYLADMTYADVCRVRKKIEERALSLVCYTPEQCIYPVNLAADSEYQRRRSLKYFEDNLRAAAELGTDKMLVTTGWGYLDDSNIDEAWKYAVEGLNSLGNMAKHYGMKLVLEVLRRDESNLVYNLTTLQKMMKELNHPAIGTMIDTIPMALAGECPEDYLRLFGEKLLHVHFIDGAPGGHLAWGDGSLDMKVYLEEFSRYSYKGCLSLEITDGRYRMDPTASVVQSVERLYDVLI